MVTAAFYEFKTKMAGKDKQNIYIYIYILKF